VFFVSFVVQSKICALSREQYRKQHPMYQPPANKKRQNEHGISFCRDLMGGRPAT
jgi:hypothetical protein